MRPGPFTTKTVKELFIKGTEPTADRRLPPDGRHRRGERPALAGRLRRADEDGRRARLQPGRGEPSRTGRRTTTAGRSGRRAGRASAAARRAPAPRTSTAAASTRSAGAGAGSSPRPSSARWPRARAAAAVRRSRSCLLCPTDRRRAGRRTRREPGQDAEARRRARPVSRRQSLTIVAPSPPSPRSPGPDRLHERMARRPRSGPRRAGRPVPEAVDDQHLVEAGQRGVVEVAVERVERLVDAGAAQVERRGDAPGPLEPKSRRRSSRRAGARARRRRPPASASGSPVARGRASRLEVVERDADPHPAGLERRPLARPARAPRSGPPSRRSGSAPARRRCHVVRPARPAPARGSAGGRRAAGASWRLGPGDGGVERRRRDGLALERLAGRLDLVAEVGDEPLRLGPGGADRARRARAARGGAPRRPSRRASAARARPPGPARAPRSSRPRSRGSGRASPRTPAGSRDRRDRASATIAGVEPEPLGDRERLAAAGQADRQPVRRR